MKTIFSAFFLVPCLTTASMAMEGEAVKTPHQYMTLAQTGEVFRKSVSRQQNSQALDKFNPNSPTFDPQAYSDEIFTSNLAPTTISGHPHTGINIQFYKGLYTFPSFIFEEQEIFFPENIVFIYFSRNHITHIPASIKTFVGLKKLNLEDNELIEIPPEIGELKNLENLDVSNNKISKVTEKLGQLPSLKELNLNDNQLKEFPPSLPTSLEELYLAGNQISEIPPGIEKMVNLKELGLACNKIITLPSKVTKLSQLEQLFLNRNNITTLQPEILNWLKTSSSLWNFTIDENPLDGDTKNALEAIMKKKPKLFISF